MHFITFVYCISIVLYFIIRYLFIIYVFICSVGLHVHMWLHISFTCVPCIRRSEVNLVPSTVFFSFSFFWGGVRSLFLVWGWPTRLGYTANEDQVLLSLHSQWWNEIVCHHARCLCEFWDLISALMFVTQVPFLLRNLPWVLNLDFLNHKIISPILLWYTRENRKAMKSS